MSTTPDQRCTAFRGHQRIASGNLLQVILEVKNLLKDVEKQQILIFDDVTSKPIDVDFRGSTEAVLERLSPASPERRGPGRPRLGVVAREVTLLPRHWDWLGSQPGGASVALRRLVDEARRTSGARDQKRQAQEAAYRFMSAMAGDMPGYEEATRALFAGERRRFDALTQPWPPDIRDHARQLAAPAFRDASPDNI
ncbi:DUF2239 family protein [Vineibacter terrae]|uniref:DUF2239 family protein n=1 Tax=Vineibacter terrae TaxID=2586908 RepID=A0A5C8PT13_9HYPH|nr:DUF2239 family protein [Vineibacter terrae]TXL80456.1 DUF2239 family protein [Vineibacter terrae]